MPCLGNSACEEQTRDDVSITASVVTVLTGSHTWTPAGWEVKDYGNLTFEDVAGDESVGAVKCVRAVASANRRLSEAVQKVKTDGHTSVLLGGDHRSGPTLYS